MRLVPHRDAQKVTNDRMREQGFTDGYTRKPARFTLREYQAGYRHGSIARDAFEEQGDDAA